MTSFLERAGYGLGGMTFSVKEAAYSTFVLLFYTQVLGLAGTAAGIALAVAVIFDAVSDPVIGAWSDRLESRWGRRHPFMVAGTLPMGLGFIGLFTVPDSVMASQTLMTLWVMSRSPLMWGGDPISSSEKSYSYLNNPEVLEVQKRSHDNRQLYHLFNGEAEDERIWVARANGSGDRYVALFNISEEEREVSFLLELESMRGTYTVRDLWQQAAIGEVSESLSATLPPHGSALYRLSPVY